MRKVDATAMREAFGQVTDELKTVQRTRKEDMERLDASIATVSLRMDANSRKDQERSFALEQSLQTLQAKIQSETDERTSADQRLDARISEGQRFTDAAVASEAKCRDENIKSLEESIKRKLGEEAQSTKVSVDKIAAQVLTLSGDIERDRGLNADQAREVAGGLAELQGAISAEEQARTQATWQLQRRADLIREEIVNEAKERRAAEAATSEELALMRRAGQQRDD